MTTKTKTKKTKKSNFWDRQEMNSLMSEFKLCFDIDKEAKTIDLKPGKTKFESDAKYNKFHRRHEQMAEVVMPNNRSEDRIAGCVAKLYEAMMFSWDPNVNQNSYGFMYRTAYLYSIDWISGKIDGSCAFFEKKHSSIKRHKIQDIDIPEDTEVRDHARFIAQEVLGWDKWKLERDDRNNCWDISFKGTYNPYTSFDAFGHALQVQDVRSSRSIANLADDMNWNILAEYIPDVPASDMNRELAYTFLEIMQDLVENQGQVIAGRAYGGQMFTLLKERVDVHITRQRVADVRHIVRQAYRWYAEDHIEGDDHIVGTHHGVSFDFTK